MKKAAKIKKVGVSVKKKKRRNNHKSVLRPNSNYPKYGGIMGYILQEAFWDK